MIKENIDIPSENISLDKFEKMAVEISKGNDKLKDLLIYCFENNIKIHTCKFENDNQSMPYIEFFINEQDIGFILKILRDLKFGGPLENLTYSKKIDEGFFLGLYLNSERSEEGFESILKIFQENDEAEITELDDRRELIFKSLQNHDSISWLKIQESENSTSIKAGKEYKRIYPEQKETKFETFTIKEDGTIEFFLYSEELEQTLNRLESSTKNYAFLKKYPYNKEKADNFWNNEVKTLHINQKATLERKKYIGDENVVVVDYDKKVNIDLVAKELMQVQKYGQGCIIYFDTWKIDSRDFDNVEEIIEAYNKSFEEKKCRSLNTGRIVDYITPDQFERAAKDFSEGNENLRELLMYCFKNDIKTKSCCCGHNGKNEPYILFDINENDLNQILKILKYIKFTDGFSNISLLKTPGESFNMVVYLKSNEPDKGFKLLLEILQKEEVTIDELDANRQFILKTLLEHVVPGIWIELQERNDTISIAVSREYTDIFPINAELLLWYGDGYCTTIEKWSKEASKILENLESKVKNKSNQSLKWMSRFRKWYRCMEKESEDIKDKFIRMKLDIMETIKERVGKKDEREQK